MKLKSQSGDASFETDLSADEKNVAEVKAACMIIDERMNAYKADLTSLQTKLEGLNERLVQAESSYSVRLHIPRSLSTDVPAPAWKQPWCAVCLQVCLQCVCKFRDLNSISQH
jgi:hypothetical protein